jgi:hypothetical protein
MTYNQVINELQTILGNHPMITEVRYTTPLEWLNRDEVPKFPVACYMIDSGNYNLGKELIYTCQFWFLDKSGQEAEFETEVISDQHGIANDIVNLLRKSKIFTIDDSISWTAISEKFEDYISGINLTINISSISQFDYCDYPS